MKRRDFLKGLAASLVVYQPAIAAITPKISEQSTKKVVWVLLRGALDSLHTIVPTFEPELHKLRPTLYQSIQGQCLALEKGFALHPSLVNLQQWYQQQQLLPIVAVSSGYQRRSHFDGQDFLESGLPQPDLDSGWLARAIQVQQKQAMAIAQSTPISLRGSTQRPSTWYPSRLPDAQQDTYQALQTLYQDTPDLLNKLNEGLATEALLEKQQMKNKQKGNFIELSRSCGQLLVEDNLDCAMLSLGGWDTHQGQANRLKRQLSVLDNGLQALKASMGKQWQDTLVIVATEFGRTVKENGTRGTDHGTGSALFLAGGAVKGGQILGEWPGLKTEQLYKKRDLQATSNSFDWIATALQQHWQLTDKQLESILPTRKVYQKQLIRV